MSLSNPSLCLTRRSPGGELSPLPARLADALAPGPWLVVAPHDDDLVLGMGMTAAAARREGIEVHVAVATDGALGYIRPSEQPGLVQTRSLELERAALQLGIPAAHLHRLGLPDGGLVDFQGARPAGREPSLGQRLVALLRALSPRLLLVCTPADVHPDHRVCAAEAEIACFWASSRIWLELGEPIALPARFRYAVYCPFETLPELEVAGDEALLEQKLAALAAFESQGVIEAMVERLRADGPFEYFERAPAPAYRPSLYRDLFRT